MQSIRFVNRKRLINKLLYYIERKNESTNCKPIISKAVIDVFGIYHRKTITFDRSLVKAIAKMYVLL